jgi:hypothetical protein
VAEPVTFQEGVQQVVGTMLLHLDDPDAARSTYAAARYDGLPAVVVSGLTQEQRDCPLTLKAALAGGRATAARYGEVAGEWFVVAQALLQSLSEVTGQPQAAILQQLARELSTPTSEA